MLDLSCRRRPDGEERGDFLVVTDKWQKFTRFAVTRENLERLGDYCDEFLVHGVDAEVLKEETRPLSKNDYFCVVTSIFSWRFRFVVIITSFCASNVLDHQPQLLQHYSSRL